MSFFDWLLSDLAIVPFTLDATWRWVWKEEWLSTWLTTNWYVPEIHLHLIPCIYFQLRVSNSWIESYLILSFHHLNTAFLVHHSYYWCLTSLRLLEVRHRFLFQRLTALRLWAVSLFNDPLVELKGFNLYRCVMSTQF